MPDDGRDTVESMVKVAIVGLYLGRVCALCGNGNAGLVLPGLDASPTMIMCKGVHEYWASRRNTLSGASWRLILSRETAASINYGRMCKAS